VLEEYLRKGYVLGAGKNDIERSKENAK